MLNKYTRNAVSVLHSLHTIYNGTAVVQSSRVLTLRAIHSQLLTATWASNPYPLDHQPEGRNDSDEKETVDRSGVDVDVENVQTSPTIPALPVPPGITKQSFEIQGRKWTAETGRLARLADGAVTIRCGGTTALATVTSAEGFRPFRDATVPWLKVDYREKLYAVGRIPGTYNKREGSPKEHEQLAARRIERALRPLLPRGYIHETSISASILSADGRDDPEILAINAASAALAASDVPLLGPLAAVRVSITADGKIIIGRLPMNVDNDNSRCDELMASLLVAVTGDDRIVMLEAEGIGSLSSPSSDKGEEMVGVPEEVLIDALHAGVKAAQAVLLPLRQLAAEGGRPKRHAALAGADPAAARRVEDLARDAARKILRSTDLDCLGRTSALVAAKAAISEAMRTAGCWRAEFSRVPGSGCVTASDIDHAFSAALGSELRALAIQEGLRADGRGPIDIRPLKVDADYVPVVHGSAVFESGETQSLCTVTVGSKTEQQRMESLLGGDSSKRLFVHFSLPEFSAGAAARDPGGAPIGPIARHEMDRSEFVERALGPALPSEGDFPFTLRLNAETLAADGGSGAAAVTGSAVALEDAGVPLRSMVAGVGIVLVSEGGAFTGEASTTGVCIGTKSESESAAAAGGGSDGGCAGGILNPMPLNKYELLTDPIAAEVSYGDMELRVAGTSTGVTAVQLDVRIPGGVPLLVVQEALHSARFARLKVLSEVKAAMPSQRDAHAPAFGSVKIPASMIGKVVGREGSTLRAIETATQSKLQANADGSVLVFAASAGQLETAKAAVISAAGGNLEQGRVYTGTVVGLKDFGAFIALPGTELHALCHVSEVALERTRSAEDVLKIGQEIEVEFIGRDPRGGLRVSRRAVLRRREKELVVD